MKRPKTDPKLCFVCQEREPRFILKTTEEFKLCEACTEIVKQENELRNIIKKALYANDRLSIFSQTLGANLLPTKLHFEELL